MSRRSSLFEIRIPAVIARLAGRPSIPETSAIEPKGRGVLDTPLEPVIGLAEGETRWRGMTACCGAAIAPRLTPSPTSRYPEV